MHCAEMFVDSGRECLDGVSISDVGCVGHDTVVEAGQRRRHHITGDHLHADCDGVVDQCPADATRSAGDDRDFPCGISERHQSSGKRYCWGYGKKSGRSPP